MMWAEKIRIAEIRFHAGLEAFLLRWFLFRLYCAQATLHTVSKVQTPYSDGAG